MEEPYKIVYDFSFEDGAKKQFPILLDPHSINILSDENDFMKPEWTRLNHNQCVCCPLDSSKVLHCPIAENIYKIIEEFKTTVSYSECRVQCTTPERIYIKDTSVMVGISSLLGIIMAASKCSLMDFLKPMARFHLPFASFEETMIRSTSFFLLGQYFKEQNKMEFNFKKLDQNYAHIHQINEHLLKRIKSVVEEDADKNAIIMLHSLGKLLSMHIEYNLDEIKYLFVTD